MTRWYSLVFILVCQSTRCNNIETRLHEGGSSLFQHLLFTGICTRARMHTRTRTHTHTYTHAHTHIHTRTHTHIHTHIHTRTHIHTYTHTHLSASPAAAHWTLPSSDPPSAPPQQLLCLPPHHLRLHHHHPLLLQLLLLMRVRPQLCSLLLQRTCRWRGWSEVGQVGLGAGAQSCQPEKT